MTFCLIDIKRGIFPSFLNKLLKLAFLKYLIKEKKTWRVRKTCLKKGLTLFAQKKRYFEWPPLVKYMTHISNQKWLGLFFCQNLYPTHGTIIIYTSKFICPNISLSFLCLFAFLLYCSIIIPSIFKLAELFFSFT